MTVKIGQLQQYIDCDLDLIPLNMWNKQTITKGKIQQRGKSPLYDDWPSSPKNLKDTLAKAKQGYNVGCRLSAEDVVIDVDPRNYVGGVNSLNALAEFLGLDSLADVYPTVETGGGGYHFYLSKPVDVNLSETLEKYPGVEFKTQGRQVVAAGSKHPNGKYYEWDEFSPALIERPEIPDRLIKLLTKKIYKYQSKPGQVTSKQLELLLNQIPINDFNTNETWFPILCAAHHSTAGTGIEEFIEWSTGDLKYEGDDYLIRARWDSLGGNDINYTVNTLYKTVLAYGGDTAVVSAQSDFDYIEIGEDKKVDEKKQTNIDIEPTEEFDDEGDIDFDDIIEEPEIEPSFKPGIALSLARRLSKEASEEEIIPALRAALNAGTVEQVKAMKLIQTNLGMSKAELNDIIKEIKDRLAEDLGRILAEKALQSRFYAGKGLVFNSNGQFWAYNGKFWDTVTKQYVGRHITLVLDKMRKKIDVKVKENTIVNEAIGILERITSVRGDAMRLRAKPHPVINCNNGELWIKSDGSVKLKQHRPSSYLLQLLNVDYSPGAECPLFDNSIRATFANFKDYEDIVRHFEEFMGYVLHPDKRPAHWWLLKGPGGDGKTTLMKVLSGLLGDAVLPESIDRFKGGIGGDNHATAELVGKLLVYDDDLNRNTILPDGTLKKLSEDGEITANPKGYAGFKFTKVCTVVMLSNGFPATRDVTRGFRRRAMIIPFNRGFHTHGAITDLAEQIVKKEMAGVLNRALQGLQRLRERGQFLEPASCLLAKEQWLHQSNPVALFISEKIIRTKDFNDRIELSDCYSVYTDWCMSHNLKKIGTKQEFRCAMEDMDVIYSKAGKNKNVFRYVKLNCYDFDDFDK